MKFKDISKLGIAVIGFLFLVGNFATPAMAVAPTVIDQTINIANLGANLAAATTETEIATLVAAAQTAGLSDTDIAEAFGRASVSAVQPSILSAGYATFATDSSIDIAILSTAYSGGLTSASAVGGQGGSGPGGTGRGGPGSFNPHNFNPHNFTPPGGGSGGGGGSVNE